MPNTNPSMTLENLVTEFVDLIRRGDRITSDEFAAKHPECSEEITQLFPAIESMERLRIEKLSPSATTLSSNKYEGKRLGDFQIQREIGRGGMGVVFVAQQISLAREVALKVLPPGFVADARYLKRFQREAKIAANLHHTNIVPVFGVGQDNDVLYIVMQNIHGVGLDKLIDSRRNKAQPLSELESLESSLGELVPEPSPNEVDENQSRRSCFDRSLSRSIAQIGLQASNALQYAHEQGVLHRDVTPGNLLLDRHGNVWVADFGLASAVESESITETGGLMGTLKYMAPELYCHECDARSDVYSLGLTLYELAVLQPARNTKEFFRCIAENRSPCPAPNLRRINPDIDRNLESIIMRSIEPHPELRYQSARDLAIDFELFLAGEPLKTQRPSSLRKAMRWAKRNPVAAAASCLAVAMMVLVTLLSSVGYMRELNHRAQTERIAGIATDALDEIYAQLAPRNLPQDMPAIRSGTSPVSSFDVVQMPSDEMLAVLEKLQSHYERVSEFSFDASIKLKAADAKNRIGQINIYLGKLAAAEHSFLGASQMCLEILDSQSTNADPIRDDAQVLLASTWNQLGYVYRGQFNDTLAIAAHDQAFTYLNEYEPVRQNLTAFQFELARTLYSQDIYRSPSEPESQHSRTQKALRILDQLDSLQADESEIQLLKARCYRRLSEQQGTFANESDLESVQIMRELVKRFPDIPQYQFELGYSLLGNHFTKDEQASDYFQRIQEALQIAQQLMEAEPNVPRYVQLAVLANEKHAKFRLFHGDCRLATNFNDTAIRLQRSLVKRFPQLVAQHRVFLYALKLESTNLMIEQQKFESARLELQEITQSVEQLIENPKLTDDWHTLRVLTASFDGLARISKQLQKYEQAKAARQKADHYRERLYRVSL